MLFNDKQRSLAKVIFFFSPVIFRDVRHHSHTIVVVPLSTGLVIWLILAISAFTIAFTPAISQSESTSDNSISSQTTSDTSSDLSENEKESKNEEKLIAGLLAKANENLENGKLDEAATAFYEIYLNFPDAKPAENALWQSAKLRKKISLNSRDADFEQVRDLFRTYINYFPKSNHIPEAYLELGVSYYYMHFYRESLSYLNLFIEKYRDSPLILQAKKWKSNTLVKIGKEAEAEEFFKTMLKDKDPALRTVGNIAMGDLRYIQGRYRRSKDYYQIVLSGQPEYYLADPEILRKAGMADIKFGKVARGRQELYHYLSLEQEVVNQMVVLASLADSYYLAGEYKMANSLFEQVIKKGVPGERVVLLANLRLAQYKDSSSYRKSKWEKPHDLKDVKGDSPYWAVLDSHFKGSMAQEARYGLFMRFKARHDLDNAYDIGRSFLRNSVDYQNGTPESKKVGDVLLYLVHEFLQAKKYQEIYNLYFVDYRHVKDFPDGRLLYMVGQAMEGLGLYDQAAVVYYRALKWNLPDEDKANLYFHRAHVYLLLKDYASANRLLTYLRKIYKDSDKLGEVFFYSGQLAEANNNKNAALDYYQKAVASSTLPDRMVDYAGDAIRLALELGNENRAYDVWRMARKVGGLKPVDAQELALEIGNTFRKAGLWDKAVDVYRAGLTDLPTKGKNAQYCNLYLGDSLLGQGKIPEGITYYKKAEAGEDATIKQLAAERLQQNEIARKFTDMQKVTK